jgi:hypothetical protein
MKNGFGIWYDDGRMDFGWLAEEGRHGRQSRIERLSLEEAQKIAERQALYDKDTIFQAAPLDSDHEEMFTKVRRMAKERRLESAKKALSRAEEALADANADRKTAYDHLLDDE